jgi:hypothetical protein
MGLTTQLQLKEELFLQEIYTSATNEIDALIICTVLGTIKTVLFILVLFN